MSPYRNICVLGFVVLSCIAFISALPGLKVPEIACTEGYYKQAVALENMVPQVAQDSILKCLKKSQPSLSSSIVKCPDGKEYHLSALLSGTIKAPLDFALCGVDVYEEMKKPGVLPSDKLAAFLEAERKVMSLFTKAFGLLMG